MIEDQVDVLGERRDTMSIGQTRATIDRKLWLRSLGFTGFSFFLLKGLFWLLVPTLLALFR